MPGGARPAAAGGRRRSVAGVRSPPFVIAVAVCTVSPTWAAARGWERPVGGPVLRPFSVAADRFAAGQHRGVDLAAPRGAWVRAACGGRVSFAGRVPRGGRTVSVRCGRLLATHQHLGAVTVRRGQAVAPGAWIGTVGSARPRPHVHLGAREAASGAYVDPLALLAGAPRATPPALLPARRPLPLGPAPARRPLPVRPAPVGLPTSAAARRPSPATPAALGPPIVAPTAPSPAHGRAARLPWPVWLGLALFGLGLPLGGLVRLRKRQARAPAGVPQAAS